MKEKTRVWVARLLIGLVTGWNLQAALVFILQPHRFATGFELSGEPGSVAVRGTGILFLMWNVPYLLALWNPSKYRLELGLALIMQFIGVVGESSILVTVSERHSLLRESMTRFLAFDTCGLILLIIAFLLMNRSVRRQRHS